MMLNFGRALALFKGNHSYGNTILVLITLLSVAKSCQITAKPQDSFTVKCLLCMCVYFSHCCVLYDALCVAYIYRILIFL